VAHVAGGPGKSPLSRRKSVMTVFPRVPAPHGGKPVARQSAKRLSGLAPLLVAFALGCDQAQPPTAPERVQPDAVSAETALTFAQVSAGDEHTCGVTPTSVAYCWGYNNWGQVGDGSTVKRLLPVRVLGGLAFRQVSAGFQHTCGVTTSNVAYCWGLLLGSGTFSSRPVRVGGGLAFRSVSAGAQHNCGVTTANVAYCWGNNFGGGLGDGTTTPRTLPVRVLGGLAFAEVNAGFQHTCGLTTSNVAYCWGSNLVGELGRGTIRGPETCSRPDRDIPCSTRPVRVVGGLAWAQVSAGSQHACGVTTSNLSYCWGSNAAGQLGNGTDAGPERCLDNVPCSTRPVRVVGAIVFRVVRAGGTSSHTCGVTAADVAYCWGANAYGQLGDGTTTRRVRPVRVLGGLAFREVTAGGNHTCGITPTKVAYCWGRNFYGQLGDGTTTTRSRPVRRVG
jgi:alpha-tubulin suppressor-like RCC1 family protein